MGIVLIFFFIITLTYLIQYDLIDSVCASELDFVLRFERNRSNQLEIPSRSTSMGSSILKLSDSSKIDCSAGASISTKDSHVNKSFTNDEEKSEKKLTASVKSNYVSNEVIPSANGTVMLIQSNDLKPEVC
jgi:hypothetical protein